MMSYKSRNVADVSEMFLQRVAGSWNSLKKLRRSWQTQSSVHCVVERATLLLTASRIGQSTLVPSRWFVFRTDYYVRASSNMSTLGSRSCTDWSHCASFDANFFNNC